MADKKKSYEDLIEARRTSVFLAVVCSIMAALMEAIILIMTGHFWSPKSGPQLGVAVLTAATVIGMAAAISYSIKKRRAEKNFRTAFGHDYPHNTKESGFMRASVYSVLQKLAKTYDAACKKEEETLKAGLLESFNKQQQLGAFRVIEADFQEAKRAFWFAHGAASLFELAPYSSYKDYVVHNY